MPNFDVVLLRSQDIVSDTRVLRWESVFKKHNIKYLILGWDRIGGGLVRENTEYCRSRAGFQQGIKGILGRIKLNIFLFKWLLRNIRRYRYIHACDLDTVISAIFMKVFGKKVIFDIFDWHSDELNTKWRFIKIVLRYIECLAVRLADLVIICEENRINQIGFVPSKYLVIRNMSSKMHNFPRGISQPFSIVYVGGIVKHRGLKELLVVASKHHQINVHIAGFGDENLIQLIKKVSRDNDNVFFYGKLEYTEAVKLMNRCELLYAMYYTSNANHIYAAPNKFYESLMLGKPILTNCGTLVSDMVTKYNTGYVIDEGIESLEQFILWWIKNSHRSGQDVFSNVYKTITVKQEDNIAKYISAIKSM